MPTRTFFPGGAFAPFFEGTGPTFPDYELLSIDDEQVKGIILGLGLTQLLADLPMPKPDTGLGEAIGFAAGNHPTHWFFIERYQHWPSPKDNGFTLRGWPKSKFTSKQVGEILDKYCAEVCIGPVTFRVHHKDENKS